jgi:hypothetical protein
MAHGRADTPASGKLLAATLLALDGDGYRSQVDSAVSARVYALIADLPSCESAAYGQLSSANKTALSLVVEAAVSGSCHPGQPRSSNSLISLGPSEAGALLTMYE